MVDGDADRYRVEDVDARADVGVGVCGVEASYHVDEDVVPAERIEVGTQILSVRPDRVDDEADGHSGKEVGAAAVEVGSGSEEEVSQCDRDEGEP